MLLSVLHWARSVVTRVLPRDQAGDVNNAGLCYVEMVVVDMRVHSGESFGVAGCPLESVFRVCSVCLVGRVAPKGARTT
jgi:hypothetical protein